MKVRSSGMKWALRSATTGILVLMLGAAAWRGDDLLYNTGKAVDLFGAIYRHLMTSYVDRLDPVRLMKAGIEGMLSTIDPYTVFVEDRSKGELDLLTTGSYGGIGINVFHKGNTFIVSEINPSANQANGLRIGDVLLEVDSVCLTDGRVRELKYYLRGPSGSEVRMLVDRPGVGKAIPLVLTRHDIDVPSILYHTRMDNDIMYIRLDRFTRMAGQDVSHIMQQAQHDKPLNGFILDLRDNPGGLLESAVDLVEKFVPRGSLIVSTRGRNPNYSRRYYSTEEPLNAIIPMVVLVNHGSASSSEIVAGAIQDHDRGIILGTQTYGKGLVQSVIPLNYDASLKITTSKYYVPSGRCIQSERYDSSVSSSILPGATSTKDRIFRTLQLGRVVKEAGGIMPDLIMDTDSVSLYLQRIRSSGAILTFVAYYINTHPDWEFRAVDTEIRSAFFAYLDTALPASDSELHRRYRELLSAAERSEVPPSLLHEIQQLSKRIEHSDRVVFDSHWGWLEQKLNQEFIAQSFGVQQGLASSLTSDELVQKARELLMHHEMYSLVLRGSPSPD